MVIWLGVVRTAVRLVGPDWWRPWRSELLRWRMETYGVQDEQGRLLTASQITPARFRRFVAQRRRTLWRLLVWAATISSTSTLRRDSGV